MMTYLLLEHQGKQSERKVHKQSKQSSCTLKKTRKLQTLVRIQQVVLDFSGEPASTSSPHGKSNRRPSVMKEVSVGCFLSPLLSFLAFVPLKLFKSMVYFSNLYAAQVMVMTSSKQISGAR
jgi:hypothetical protein